MSFSKALMAIVLSGAAVLVAAGPVAAADAFPTTDATAVIIPRTGTVDGFGRAILELAVVCPTTGTVDGLFLTFEQRRRGQVTAGFTDYESVAIPCSPEGTPIRLALEVFTDIPFGPGRIVLTDATVCGLGGCRTFALTGSVILHRG